MKKVFRIPQGSRAKPVNYLVLSDVHDFDMDQVAFSLALQAFDRFPKKQRKIILLGDILDFPWLFKGNPEFQSALKYRDFDDFFVPNMEATVNWFDDFYSKLLKYVDSPNDIYFMEGNHEQRCEREYFASKIPVHYRHFFDLKTVLNVEKQGFNHFRCNTWFKMVCSKMPPLFLTHGQKCGSNPTKKHFDLAHSSVMFGHTHEIGVHSFNNIENTMISYNNPCLCIEENAKYLEQKVTNWSVGFSEIQTNGTSYFVNIHNIWNNELMIDGTVLSGNRKNIQN